MNDTPIFEPPNWLDREDEVLAPYAMRTRQSKGRKYPEPAHAFRTLYQRDRDRIVHSTAFRRLMHKTQVLVNQPGDYLSKIAARHLVAGGWQALYALNRQTVGKNANLIFPGQHLRLH